MWALIAADARSSVDQTAFHALAVGVHGRIGSHAKRVADLGATVGVAITLVALLVAVNRRRWELACAILGGFLLAESVGDAIKALAGRSRPTGQLIHASGPSFPSTDSAISVGFVLVAAILAAHLRPGWRRIAAVGLGVLASLVTGLLTIAFRDHYLTDVLGGWGLGAAAFGLCAWVALWSERRRTTRPSRPRR
jgi:undecaprenyl-diphosphatase